MEDLCYILAVMALTLAAILLAYRRQRTLRRIHLTVFLAYNLLFFYLLHSDAATQGRGLVVLLWQLVANLLQLLVVLLDLLWQWLQGRNHH